MEMEKGHTSLKRGVSWSPGGLRKPLQLAQDPTAQETDYNTSWEKTGVYKERESRKTSLSRSASLSEKELKEARVRSQIIAAQLTVPSSSSSRGVQLFNRRRQRVNAFTLGGRGAGPEEERKAEDVKSDPSSARPTWAERSSEEKDRDLNLKNGAEETTAFSPTVRIHSGSDTTGEPGREDNMEEGVMQERHFLPVKEEQEEEEETRGEIREELEDDVKGEIPSVMERADGQAEMNGSHTGPAPAGNLPNGCHSGSGPGRASVPTSRQTSATTTNRTARPFFSPPPVRSPETLSPVKDIPPPPSYSTPPLPTCTNPQPVAFSPPPPPPPSYPTPPLPAFTNQPPQTCRHPVPPAASPAVLVPSAPLPHFPVSQYPPMPHYGPPTAPKPSTFVPQPSGERKLITPIKTGILEEGVVKRANKKSMFTFKEKTVVTPNPELLSLVQGVDERKKYGHRSVPEPAPEEELLALGAEASNFLAKEEDRAEEARAPEWASCLKSSRTQPRVEHRPEQTLTNVSGRGAQLFAKRQSRMEKYVLEEQKAGQRRRSPSPTMSLPPSWVYPSNMPGRVKAIAKNSEMSAQLTQNHLKAQQAVKQKPRQRAAAPQPVPEPPPLENGCSKIEMDLSRHRPYQLDSSLFIINPVKDPVSTLPKGAPQSRSLNATLPFSRQTSLPSNPPSHFKHVSPQMPLSPTGGAEYRSSPAPGPPRITSPTSAFSPERVSSPRSGAQAPRPTFSAKKAGIAPQMQKESSHPAETSSETSTPTRTPSLSRRFSGPEGPSAGTWTSSLQRNHRTTSSFRSVTSPVSSPSATRCQSPIATHNLQFSTLSPTSTSAYKSSQAAAATSPCSPPRGSRSQSPLVSQSSTTTPTSTSTFISAFRPSTSPLSPSRSARCPSPKSSTAVSFTTSRPSQTPTVTTPRSPSPWGSRCQSPLVVPNTQSSSISFIPAASRAPHSVTATSPCSPPWGSRCQSPLVLQSNQSPSVFTSTSKPSQTSAMSPGSPPWGSRSQSPSVFQTSLSFPASKPLYPSSVSSPVHSPKDSCCMSPVANNLDTKANHRLLAKNIINAAKRKNSPSPGALSGHSLPISPLGNSHHGCDPHKPPISPFPPRSLGAQSPTFTSPPATPTQRICSPVRLYNTRSLTDSDASVESEDSGLRSPGPHSYNTCPRGWGGSLRVKRSTVSTDL